MVWLAGTVQTHRQGAWKRLADWGSVSAAGGEAATWESDRIRYIVDAAPPALEAARSVGMEGWWQPSPRNHLSNVRSSGRNMPCNQASYQAFPTRDSRLQGPAATPAAGRPETWRPSRVRRAVRAPAPGPGQAARTRWARSLRPAATKVRHYRTHRHAKKLAYLTYGSQRDVCDVSGIRAPPATPRQPAQFHLAVAHLAVRPTSHSA